MQLSATSCRRTALSERVYQRSAEIELARKEAEIARLFDEAAQVPRLKATIAELKAIIEGQKHKLAERAFADAIAPQVKKRVREVIAAVCRHYGMKAEMVLGYSHKPVHAHPRQMAMYVSNVYFGCSLPQIGGVLKRDHTTVLHGIRAVKARLEAGDTSSSDALRGVLTALSHSSVEDDGSYWGA